MGEAGKHLEGAGGSGRGALDDIVIEAQSKGSDVGLLLWPFGMHAQGGSCSRALQQGRMPGSVCSSSC